jgi:uncharacterized protein DUF3489
MPSKPANSRWKRARKSEAAAAGAPAQGQAGETGAGSPPEAPVTRRRSKRAAARPPRVTKAKQTMGMLTRPEGTTVAELVDRFDIQPHSARAIISVLPRKVGKHAERGEDGRYRVT